MVKEEQVKALVEAQGLTFKEHATIMAAIVPSPAAIENSFGSILSQTKECILHFNDRGVAVIGLDDLTGNLLKDRVLLLLDGKVKSTKLLIRIVNFIVSLETEKGIIQFKVGRQQFGCPWHNENLSFLLLQFTQTKE